MQNDKLIKVCGLVNGDNIRDVEGLNVDMMGFIFYDKSPRFVDVKPSYLPSAAKRVGVFVDADIEYIRQKIVEFSLDVVQLHGDEPPLLCKEVSIMSVEVIKAFQISSRADFGDAMLYQRVCDYLLFDTRTKHRGGSGERFDWHLLESYVGSTPFILSGGLSLDCVADLNLLTHPMLVGYDLNSKFEEYPGFKSLSKLDFFINKLQ